MQRREHRARLLLLLFVQALLCAFPACAGAEATRLLVLQDVAGERVAQANLRQIRRMLTYAGYPWDIADAWREASLDDYDAVLVVLAEGRALHEDTARRLRTGERPVFVVGSGALEQLTETVTAEGAITVLCEGGGSTDKLFLTRTSLPMLSGEGEVVGGELLVNGQGLPLCKRVGSITHMAYCDADEARMAAMLADFLLGWLRPDGSPPACGQYLVLSPVYPFQEPEDLVALTDVLENERLPYAVCVMPIYEHVDYPAMKRFCQWLRYIQSKGVAIVLHAPLMSPNDVEAYRKQLETAYRAYADYGVYPVALAAPEDDLGSPHGMEAISGFSTVLLTEGDGPLTAPALTETPTRQEEHRLLAPYTQGSAFTTAYPQAIYLDANASPDELRRRVQTLGRSGCSLMSLAGMAHSVQIGDDCISRSPTGGLEVNGQPFSLAYTAFEDEEYRYDRGIVQYMTEQIQTSNRIIMGFVLLASACFAAFMLLSRQAMRRELLHPPGEGHRRRDEG
ncbi:MAG: DUF2334 domain-containing protein [Clostridiales bacterium]|nr:DUF2334 domain-containing protein [Clostridiales bacterium]